MEIVSKSLHHSNIVFVFEQGKFLIPDNSVLGSLYQGEAAAGAHFIDDPILRTKVLDLPKLKLQIIVESNRLRIEDNSQEEPQSSSLIREALAVFQKLFFQMPPTGLGFNFDIYYQFRDVIRINDLFHQFADPKILEKADLRDLGIQFTLGKEGGKKQEQYFLKVTAPLELAVHANLYFPLKKLPEQTDLQKLFEKCYNEVDKTIQLLRL